MELQQAVELSKRVQNEIKKSVKGKDDCIRKAFCAILAGGHILIEDVPGVGKTTLALAFSRALSLENHRVQFTPDVLPSDVVGFIKNPIKIVLFILLVFLAWKVGNSINTKLDKNN